MKNKALTCTIITYVILIGVQMFLFLPYNVVEIFVTGKLPEEQLFFLHLTHRQIMVFYNHFSDKLEEFDLHHLVRIFENKNRKLSVDSIKESYRSFEKKQKENGISKVRVKDHGKIEWLFEVN